MQLVFINLDIIYDTTFIIIMKSNTNHQVKYKIFVRLQDWLIYVESNDNNI